LKKEVRKDKRKQYVKRSENIDDNNEYEIAKLYVEFDKYRKIYGNR
jgi:hypothetical protein